MSSDTLSPTGRRRFVRLKDANDGICSRSKYYELAAIHPGLLVKLDAITLIDLDKRDEILAALPPAKITKPHWRHHCASPPPIKPETIRGRALRNLKR
jgi:hypothetical protein